MFCFVTDWIIVTARRKKTFHSKRQVRCENTGRFKNLIGILFQVIETCSSLSTFRRCTKRTLMWPYSRHYHDPIQWWFHPIIINHPCLFLISLETLHSASQFCWKLSYPEKKIYVGYVYWFTAGCPQKCPTGMFIFFLFQKSDLTFFTCILESEFQGCRTTCVDLLLSCFAICRTSLAWLEAREPMQKVIPFLMIMHGSPSSSNCLIESDKEAQWTQGVESVSWIVFSTELSVYSNYFGEGRLLKSSW